MGFVTDLLNIEVHKSGSGLADKKTITFAAIYFSGDFSEYSNGMITDQISRPYE